MKILILLVLLCGIVAATPARSGVEKGEFVCDPSKAYKENDCNYCSCYGGEEYLECTAMACKTHLDGTYLKCERGTTWLRGCNRCWCISLGTICTADEC